MNDITEIREILEGRIIKHQSQIHGETAIKMMSGENHGVPSVIIRFDGGSYLAIVIEDGVPRLCKDPMMQLCPLTLYQVGVLYETQSEILSKYQSDSRKMAFADQEIRLLRRLYDKYGPTVLSKST